ncbi:MAG: hypothetical protein AAFN77_09840 [Planctomycetota bacterium]
MSSKDATKIKPADDPTVVENSGKSSGIRSTIVCEGCQSALVTKGILAGQIIRCGRCGKISQMGTSEALATDRMAWRSLWLGISSIFLLFITGLPAVYYGVKSLLRMRFVRPKKSDRIAAITGTALGGCFGIFIGSFVAMVGLFVLIVTMDIKRSQNPAEIKEFLAKVCTISMPTELEGFDFDGILFNSNQSFEFGDAKKYSDQTFRIRILYQRSTIGINRNTMIQQMREVYVSSSRMKIDKDGTEMLLWNIDDESVDVQKRIFTLTPKKNAESQNVSEDGNEVSSSDQPDEATSGESTESTKSQTPEIVKHYFGVITRESGIYGFVVYVNETRRPTTDEEIQQIIETLKPIE